MTQTSAPSSFEEPNNSDDLVPLAEAQLSHASQLPLPIELVEFARLEDLLSARTRSHGSLQRELERRDRLFREALVRMSTSTSQEFSALRAGYDAAVARAIEAEVARAELTFALDETRTQLTAAQPAGGVGVQNQAPGVYASGADLGASVSASASVQTQEQSATAERARLALEYENTELRRRIQAFNGELSGLRARVTEAELAWQTAFAQGQKLQQRTGTTQERVNELRAETAELSLLAQTRASHIGELKQAAAFDQQEIRTLRAQVSAATAAQVAQGDARDSDRQLWSERLHLHEEREQAAWNAAASAVARSESRLREFLGSIEQPLRQLDASLDALGSAGRAANTGELRAEASPSSAPLDVSAAALPATTSDTPSSTAPNTRRIADELAHERDRRTKLVAAVRALQAATQSGEPTKPWIEELVELVSETRPSARRRS